MRACALRQQYGAKPVLAGIDLAVYVGEVVVILGENGAGKTTLLRALAGDLALDAGEVHIAGVPLASAAETARKSMIYVAQHPPMAPLATLREHAAALIAFRHLDPHSAPTQLAELAATLHLGAAIDLPIRSLSGGMIHKAALVLAFLANTPLILLDEPHAGLDVRSALALRALIQARRATGTAFVLASHLAEATLALADRAIVLRAGQVARTFAGSELADFAGDARRFEQEVLAAMAG